MQVPDRMVRDPLRSSKSVADNGDEETFVQKLQPRVEELALRLKFWVPFVANMTGFAAIGMGSALQQTDFFKVNIWMSFLCILVNQSVLFVLFRIAAAVRGDPSRHDTP